MAARSTLRMLAALGLFASVGADEGAAPSSSSSDVATPPVVRLDMQQCQMLYDAVGGPASEVSAVLFTPIVKFVVRQGGTRCDVNWPRVPEACGGTWVVSRSRQREPVETRCAYESTKNVCSCTLVGPASEEAVAALGEQKAVQLGAPAPPVAASAFAEEQATAAAPEGKRDGGVKLRREPQMPEGATPPPQLSRMRREPTGAGAPAAAAAGAPPPSAGGEEEVELTI